LYSAVPSLGPLLMSHQPAVWTSCVQRSCDPPRGEPPSAPVRPEALPRENTFALETYVKDLHWLTEKIVLVTERSMGLLEDFRQDHSREKMQMVLPPMPVMNEQTAVVDMERIDRTIRNAVSTMGNQIALSIEAMRRDQNDSHLPGLAAMERMESSIEKSIESRSKQNQTPRSARLAEDKLKTFKESGQTPRTLHADASFGAQAQVLDVMMVKIDKLGGLVDQMRKSPRGLQSPVPQMPQISVAAAAGITNMGGPTPVLDPVTGPVRVASPMRSAAMVSFNVNAKKMEDWQDSESEDGIKKAGDLPQLKLDEKPLADLSRSVSAISAGSVGTHDSEQGLSFLEKVVTSTAFEMGFGLLIVLSTVKMCVEAEYQGWYVGHKLAHPGIAGRLATTQATTDSADFMFYILELFFGCIFTVEVVIKMWALKCRFWRCGWNIFDTMIIGIAWFTFFINIKLPVKPMLLRLFRLIRLLRLLKVLSRYEVFDDLQLMVKALSAGVPVLIWVIILVGPVIACCSLGLVYTLIDYIEDDSLPIDVRVVCYNYFGTFSKAMLSMFEVTFGNWVPICRFLYKNVDERFALFFIAWKLVVGVAVLRVIYGVFLHVTFRCVHANEELLIAQKIRADKKYRDKIYDIFRRFETSGSGGLSWDEFSKITEDEKVSALLGALDLDIKDAKLVFELANLEGDELSPEEMIEGFGKLKGTARSVDIGNLLSMHRKSMEKINEILDRMP